MKNEIMDMKTFLQNIIPDIEIIDGGCKDCIESFCNGINDSLFVYGFKLEVSEEYPIIVTIIDL